MAFRPVFVPDAGSPDLVEVVSVRFQWHSGLSFEQKQRSVASLHRAARQQGIGRILEISTKSFDEIGQRLSAFDLEFEIAPGVLVPVEAVFQASKVFERGGPYLDLLRLSGRDAKRDPRLKCSGSLVRFEYSGRSWSLLPRTAFYDWIYLSALARQPQLARQLLKFDGFTDIEFNPETSVNCQARSAALFVALSRRGLLEGLTRPDTFLRVVGGNEPLRSLVAPDLEGQAQFDLFPTQRKLKRPKRKSTDVDEG